MQAAVAKVAVAKVAVAKVAVAKVAVAKACGFMPLDTCVYGLGFRV